MRLLHVLRVQQLRESSQSAFQAHTLKPLILLISITLPVELTSPLCTGRPHFTETDTSEVVMNPLSGSSEPALVNGPELYSQYPALTPPTYSPDGQSCTTNWNLYQIFIDVHVEELMIGLQSCDFVHSYKKFITSASPEYDIDVN